MKPKTFTAEDFKAMEHAGVNDESAPAPLDAPVVETPVVETPAPVVEKPIDTPVNTEVVANEKPNILDKFKEGADTKKEIPTEAGADFRSVSNEDLVKRELNLKYPNASKEDIDILAMEEMDKWEGLSEARQRIQREEMISNLEKLQPENDIFKTLSDIKKQQGVDPIAEQQAKLDEAVGNIKNFFEETAKSIIGKEYNGYVVTKEMAEAIPAAFQKDASSFDQEQRFIDYLKVVTYDDMKKKEFERGVLEAMKKASNPTQNHQTSSTVIMPMSEEQKPKDAAYFAGMQQVNQ